MAEKVYHVDVVRRVMECERLDCRGTYTFQPSMLDLAVRPSKFRHLCNGCGQIDHLDKKYPCDVEKTTELIEDRDKERRTLLQPVQIQRLCDTPDCDGTLVRDHEYSKIRLLSADDSLNLVSLMHVCTKCDARKMLLRSYPYIAYEALNEGNT